MTGDAARRVLVTRPPESWPRLAARFAASAVAIELHPTTRSAEALDPGPGAAALDRLSTYDWLVVTSGRGVAALSLGLAVRGIDRIPKHLRVGAVGPATARALEGVGARVELVADETGGDALARELARRIAPGATVLVVRPEGGAGVLAGALRAAGLNVDEAPLYRTIASEEAFGLAESAIGGRWEAIAFTAPSSLTLWLEAAGARRDELRRAVARVLRVAIGPTTAAHLRAVGLPAAAVAHLPGEDAVGDALAKVLGVP